MTEATTQMQALADPYFVQPGDTLTGIAKRSGRSIPDLVKWNGLARPDKLKAGQSLYLSEASAYGVSVLFLDALRCPIENLSYRLCFDGKTVANTTDSTGLAPRQQTKSAKSEIQVLVQNAEKQWQQVASTISGHGHKLITLVSGAIVIKGSTEKLPAGAPAVPSSPPKPKPKPKAQPTSAQVPLPKPASGMPSRNNPSVRTQKAKGPQGQSIVKVGVDIPQELLNYFANYKGGEISEKDWKDAADAVLCEIEVLKAIASVESGGHSSFWRLNNGEGAYIPAILFERHCFSRLTDRAYDKTHPDISWKTGYQKSDKLGNADSRMPDGTVESSDLYGDHASAYLRLINAYRLDADAALKACSWGKFQVLGENFGLCGTRNVDSLVKSMCTSELEQIKLLTVFIQRKPRSWKDTKNKALGKEISLWEAVKAKDWPLIAFNYNGSGYKTFRYDEKLKIAYENFKSNKT